MGKFQTIWQSDVSQAELLGELEEGTTFKWKAGGIGFTSELHTVIEYQAIGWTGKTFGAKAIHNWYFERKDGGTLGWGQVAGGFF